MELHSPAEFFLVRHSKKGVEVFRSAGLRAESIQFSEGVPRTLEEALAFKAPDHDLETRAASGSSARAMRGVRQLLGAASEAPLVLAGVDEDTVRYRMINRYPNLLARSIHGSLSCSVETDTLAQAYAIVRSDCAERAVRALQDSQGARGTRAILPGLSSILRAAAGRARGAPLYRSSRQDVWSSRSNSQSRTRPLGRGRSLEYSRRGNHASGRTGVRVANRPDSRRSRGCSDSSLLVPSLTYARGKVPELEPRAS